MAAGSDSLLRYIRGLVPPSESDGVSDAALLGRFITKRDETAFTALVVRHGPLVLHVCQRVLGDVHDAEDAFQAAFLVLARKAAALRHPEALPAWLHGVARRAALKARSAKTRRFRDTKPLIGSAPDPRPDPLADLSVRELLLIIDEELERLPEMYRLPVILCCLESRSLEEAARQLGWTLGSVKGRLERGRARLHRRLVRRGLTLSSALAAVEASRATASAAVIARLAAATAQGALAFGAYQTVAAPAVSAAAATLAGNVIRGMAAANLKAAGTLLLVICLLATGFLAYKVASPHSPTAPQPDFLASEGKAALAAPAAVVRNHPGDPPDEADAPIDVNGRVLDPEGAPIAGAKLYVGYSVRRQVPDGQLRPMVYPLRSTTGPDGRFRFHFAKSELEATWLDHSWPAVIAVAEGYGPDWTDIRGSATATELTLKLVKDLPLDGRVLNNDGKPVSGATVLLWQVESYSEEALTRLLRSEAAAAAGNAWRGPLPEQPAIVTTDNNGRFRLTGLGRDRIVTLMLDGPAIVHTSIRAIARSSTEVPKDWWAKGAGFEDKASPSQSIRGVVRDKATGKPVAGVRMCANTRHPPTFTDEAGRFEILGYPKSPRGYAVMAQPQACQPYFAAKALVPDRPGFDPLTVDLDLLSGIPLSGRVTDQATGKPPRAARVEYYPLFPNSYFSKLSSCPGMAASSAVVRPDGSFRLVVLPGPGVVCVAASPCNSHAVAVIDEKELVDFFPHPPSVPPLVRGGYRGGGGGNGGENQCLSIDWGAGARGDLRVNQYHALALIRPGETAEPLALNFRLSRGRTLQGIVVGPDAKPLTGVETVGLTAIPDGETLDSSSFTVMGLNAQGSRELVLRHREKGLGKVLTIRGEQTGLLTVQLEACGSVLGRLVDKQGKPVPSAPLVFSRPNQDFDVVTKTDRAGRFRGALLPGQKYQMYSWSSRRLLKEVGELEVESGQIKDLGDLPLSD